VGTVARTGLESRQPVPGADRDFRMEGRNAAAVHGLHGFMEKMRQ
jgi:hypothetical protein